LAHHQRQVIAIAALHRNPHPPDAPQLENFWVFVCCGIYGALA